MSPIVSYSSPFGSVGVSSAALEGTTAPATAATGVSNTSLLPEPSVGFLSHDDPGAELAMMVLESAKEDKKAGRSMRDIEERAQQAAEEAQLKAMQEKADNAFMAGMIGGFATAASGMVSAAGAGAVGEASSQDAAATNAADRGALKVGQKAISVQMQYEGGAKAIDGGGKLFSTLCQGEADEADKEATHQDQLAGRHKRAAEDARDQVKDAKDLIDRAISFYKEYTTAQADAQRAAFLKA